MSLLGEAFKNISVIHVFHINSIIYICRILGNVSAGGSFEIPLFSTFVEFWVMSLLGVSFKTSLLSTSVEFWVM